jgi:ATP-dependent helicase/nuclease subunit A
LFEEFGFCGDETAASIAASAWPDSFFDTALAEALAARAADAGKAMAAKFAAELSHACSLANPEDVLLELREMFLTKKSGGVWSAKQSRMIASKGVGEHFPGFGDEFERVAGVLETACDRLARFRMLEGTRAALVLADWLIARYERLKSARGFLDFGDLITRTANLLARQDAGAWVQYKLDKGIDHILLDEAQDTSPDQWKVVKALAAEFFAGSGQRADVARTVFAVGDEKQSIYSFQGAEPEAFAISGHEFRERVTAAENRFEHVRLLHSFRSTQDVLSAVDLVFASEENRKGLTHDPEAIEHRAIRDSAPGYVELWPSIDPTIVEEPDDWTVAIDHASAPSVKLAQQIAGAIQHWLRSNEIIEGVGKPLSAGDVMVLVRKRDRFIHALTRELKNRGVPVAGADRLRLTDHIAVQDLMAIGRIVEQPDDDLSLAALLKSPIVGLDDEMLFDLAAKRSSGQSLFAALRARADTDLWLRLAADQLAVWRNEAGYKSAFEF